MKRLIFSACLAASALGAFAQERSLTEKTRDVASDIADKAKEVARETKEAVTTTARKVDAATRTGWKKTKAYLSEDAPAFREGATQTLTDLAREIRAVKERTPSDHPAYFHTRLQALDQQYDFLSGSLARMTPEQIRARSAGERLSFDECVEDLEGAIDQANAGADRLRARPAR